MFPVEREVSQEIPVSGVSTRNDKDEPWFAEIKT